MVLLKSVMTAFVMTTWVVVNVHPLTVVSATCKRSRESCQWHVSVKGLVSRTMQMS